MYMCGLCGRTIGCSRHAALASVRGLLNIKSLNESTHARTSRPSPYSVHGVEGNANSTSVQCHKLKPDWNARITNFTTTVIGEPYPPNPTTLCHHTFNNLRIGHCLPTPCFRVLLRRLLANRPCQQTLHSHPRLSRNPSELPIGLFYSSRVIMPSPSASNESIVPTSRMQTSAQPRCGARHG